jgi:hypothetical protein
LTVVSPDPVAAEAAAEADCAVSGAEVDFSESAPPHAPVIKTNDRMHNIKEKQLLTTAHPGESTYFSGGFNHW